MKIVIGDGSDGQAEEKKRVKWPSKPRKKRKDNVETVRVIGGEDPPMPGKADKGEKQQLSIHQLRTCAPLSIRKNITQKMVDLINADLDDSEIRESFQEHLLTWVDVMQEGKWKFQDYINAVKYVTHRMMGGTQLSCWTKVFPHKYQRLVDKGIPEKNISSHSTMYNKSMLVMKIMERTLPPIYILNADIFQEAINKEANLMRFAKSEQVQMKAAAILIEHLKPPENLKIDLNVGVSNDTVEDLRGITRSLAVQQRKMIQAGGMSAQGVAEMTIVKKEVVEDVEIEAEYEEVGTDNVGSKDQAVDFFETRNGNSHDR